LTAMAAATNAVLFLIALCAGGPVGAVHVHARRVTPRRRLGTNSGIHPQAHSFLSTGVWRSCAGKRASLTVAYIGERTR
jgi:hypothetical protein